jgi:DNA-directed RNA polymerase subunit RPC12/RpoP
MKALLLDPLANLARLEDFPMIDRPQVCRRCNFRRLCFPRPVVAALPLQVTVEERHGA